MLKVIQELDLPKSSLFDYRIAPTKYNLQPRPSPYDADVNNEMAEDSSMRFDLHLFLNKSAPNIEVTAPVFEEGTCPYTPKESVVSSMGELPRLPPALNLKPRPKRKQVPIKHKRGAAPSFPILRSFETP